MKRDWMIENREKLGLTREEMARRIRKPGYWQCSEKLLTLLETDAANVTHPGIAKLIAKEYYATREQAEGMWRCSECGSDQYIDAMSPAECECYFCPNCGAKMRGDTDETE